MAQKSLVQRLRKSGATKADVDRVMKLQNALDREKELCSEYSGIIGTLAEEKEKLEQRLERLETGLGELSDPMAYEHIGKFHGRKLPWAIAKKALAEEEA